MYRRIYDCLPYHGEIEALLRRLRALQDVVDVFVVVESMTTTDGRAKRLHLREEWSSVKRFAPDIRYLVVNDEVHDETPSDRSRHLLDAVRRGLLDAQATDIVHLGSAATIPSAKALERLRNQPPGPVRFDLKRGGTPASCAFPYADLARLTPSELHHRILAGTISARAVPRSVSFPSQATTVSASGPKRRQPVIVCPYLYDRDRQRVVEAFGLDSAPGSGLPFFFWQDRERIGPERAFEHCWSQFPDRDIIIVHTDMRPLPRQSGTEWYRELLTAVEAHPGAGMIACDLLFPDQSPDGEWYVQCAGGYFENGTFGYVGGRTEVDASGRTGIIYDERFAAPRPAHWVTFGGVYIRRETIDMVGPFDKRYEWAYVMDVDYCAEAAVRGLTMLQVPVTLIHEENATTREFLEQQEYLAKKHMNVHRFYAKWSWFLLEHAQKALE